MKLRHYTLLGLIYILTLPLNATTPDKELGKLEKAIFLKDWIQAESYFQNIVNTNVSEAEIFFWEQLDADTPCRLSMTKILAEYHKSRHDYNKAFVYYDELLKLMPESIETLQTCAEMKTKSGKTEEALPFYEQILLLDNNNLAANIFVGNYYYFIAEKECTQLKSNYKKLQTPTQMEYGRYRDGLNKLVISDFAKAKKHLQRVLPKFPSLEVRKALQKIKIIETENAQ